MFRLSLNESPFYYANYSGVTPTVSVVTGLPTGENTHTYASPTLAYGCISSATGRMSTDGFGWNVDYDIAIVPSKDIPITEGARLWINATPAANGTVKHDHEVVRVSRTLNEVVIAAKRLP